MVTAETFDFWHVFLLKRFHFGLIADVVAFNGLMEVCTMEMTEISRGVVLCFLFYVCKDKKISGK